MNYYGAKQLAEAFRTVRNNTIKIAEDIPEDQYNFQPAPGTRTVAQTLAHVAMMPNFAYQLHAELKLNDMAKFDWAPFIQRVMAEEQKQRTKAEIVQMLREDGDKFASWLEGVSEEFLAETVTFPPGAQPPTRIRFEMLLSAKEHEMHHRGQLMLVERMLGIVPHLTREQQARMAQMQAQSARG